jgi:SAM-dependent methyltransferase
MTGFIRRLLTEPRVRGLDVDAEAFSLAHRQVLRDKPLLRRLFVDFYRRCRESDDLFFTASGARVEIGSGAGFIGEVYPDVITSDIKYLPFVRLVCRGEALPFADGELRALYAINTFHHIPNPRAFFAELVRVLAPGGGAVLIEPYHGFLARFLFRRLHASETFESDAPSWESAEPIGPFSSANQALAYIVFERDKAEFEAAFPELELVAVQPHTHLRYLLSGGVNFRQLVPSAADPVLVALERALAPLNGALALQQTLVLRRRPIADAANSAGAS